MNRVLISINDVRKFRQIGKQINQTDFDARAKEVQDNELTELLGRSLMYDFMNFLDNGFTLQGGSFTRNTTSQFTAEGADLSAWVDYSLKLNDSIFVIVKTAVFGGADTIVTIEGYELPETLSKVEFSTENKYIKLLNGAIYQLSSKTVMFNGLRPFMSWKFLAIFTTDGSLKHSDTGNISIISPNFERSSNAAMNAARSTYLSNSIREENHITDYLNGESSLYPLWESKGTQNIDNFGFIVI